MSLEQVQRQVELAKRQHHETPRVDALTARLHEGKSAAQIISEDWSAKYRDLARTLERELSVAQHERDIAAEILLQLGRESVVAITGDIEDSADILTPHQANAAIREEIRLGREAADAVKLSVPLSVDGKTVFIDGYGVVPLDYERANSENNHWGGQK